MSITEVRDLIGNEADQLAGRGRVEYVNGLIRAVKIIDDYMDSFKPCPYCTEIRVRGYQPTTCEDCCGSGVIREPSE